MKHEHASLNTSALPNEDTSEKERVASLHPLERLRMERLAHLGTADELRAARLISLEEWQPK